jgi:hypothetical protein
MLHQYRTRNNANKQFHAEARLHTTTAPRHTAIKPWYTFNLNCDTLTFQKYLVLEMNTFYFYVQRYYTLPKKNYSINTDRRRNTGRGILVKGNIQTFDEGIMSRNLYKTADVWRVHIVHCGAGVKQRKFRYNIRIITSQTFNFSWCRWLLISLLWSSPDTSWKPLRWSDFISR